MIFRNIRDYNVFIFKLSQYINTKTLSTYVVHLKSQYSNLPPYLKENELLNHLDH